MIILTMHRKARDLLGIILSLMSIKAMKNNVYISKRLFTIDIPSPSPNSLPCNMEKNINIINVIKFLGCQLKDFTACRRDISLKYLSEDIVPIPNITAATPPAKMYFILTPIFRCLMGLI
jgi:hypothetical protein